MTLFPADDTFARRLSHVLPDDVFRPLEVRYLEEPRGLYRGQCGILAAPRSTQEVSKLMRAAFESRVPVVPYGGGTGLVGGQVMADGPAPLVVSLERMATVRGLYPAENVMVVEAGAVLADVQAAADSVDRLFPLSLASEGSARIGGNLSTNAGGTAVLRYGNTRDLCLGLEAVLPDGRIWNGLSRLRKNNLGYDVKDLLIGAEGTLGIITAASLKLFNKPAGIGTALLNVPNPAAALDLLSLAHDQLGGGVSAFELIHGQGMQFLAQELPDLRLPYAEIPEWCVLIELGLARGLDPIGALETLFGAAFESDLVTDGLIAQSEQQRAEFWNVREQIPEANRRVGAVSSHDISIPISRIPEFLDRGCALVSGIGDFRLNAFGHLGDGNLHFNVFPPKGGTKAEYAEQRDVIKQAVHDLVNEMDGSVSAEHGVGRLKTGDLERYGDPVGVEIMRSVKAALDPAGIMNPGAVLRNL